MSEKTTTEPVEAVETDVEVVEPTRLQTFVTNHPRIAKVIAITGGVTAAVGAGVVANNMRKQRAHIIEAGHHAEQALMELSNSVSPDPVGDTEN